MERNIPHVLDIFTTSPGERRRARSATQFANQLKEQQKNPGSDSAVSLGSSEDDEDERHISKYFDYLNDDDINDNRCIKNSRPRIEPRATPKITSQSEHEKDIRHIERHLSMKKTIRKKMMRDLQAAFVENPGEFQQDPSRLPPEKKGNIDIRNLTITKGRMSKSEHSFLDMLRDDSKDSRSRRLPEGKPIQKMEDNDSGTDSPTRNSWSKTKDDSVNSRKPVKEEKKSFWKRLTGKVKTKR